MNENHLASYLKLLTCQRLGVLQVRKSLNVIEENGFDFSFDFLCDFFNDKNFLKKLNSYNIQLVNNEIEFIKKNNIKYVGILDDDYPKLLKQCVDAPIVLFYKGDLSLLNNKTISIIGTRKMSAYGKQITEELFAELQPYLPTVVSGMAYGVDVHVYHQAKKHQLPKVAVMGTSFASYYPKKHQKYYEYLEQNGLIISEYAQFNKLAPEMFIRRNRLIAGLSQATVVIESAIKGGSLSTAIFANDYEREVYAVPGRLIDEMSLGCLKLIANNQAHVLNDFKVIPTDLKWDAKIVDKKEELMSFDFHQYSQVQQSILKTLHIKEMHIEEIAQKTQINMSDLNAELMMLEIEGLVKSLPGKMFGLNKKTTL